MTSYFQVRPEDDVLIKGPEMAAILAKIEELPVRQGMPIFDLIKNSYALRAQEQNQALKAAEEARLKAEQERQKMQIALPQENEQSENIERAADVGRLEAVRASENGQTELHS